MAVIYFISGGLVGVGITGTLTKFSDNIGSLAFVGVVMCLGAAAVEKLTNAEW